MLRLEQELEEVEVEEVEVVVVGTWDTPLTSLNPERIDSLVNCAHLQRSKLVQLLSHLINTVIDTTSPPTFQPLLLLTTLPVALSPTSREKN